MLRIALFVEGTRESTDASDPLEALWTDDLTSTLGLGTLDRVVGISKHHLVAMDSANRSLRRQSSAISETLDGLMARELVRRPFEVAVVAWDLQPSWDRSAAMCQWKETINFYEGLAKSEQLPRPWVDSASGRLAELRARPSPSARLSPPKLTNHAILAVCMVPMFERMLANEVGIRTALGIRGERVPRWPRDWNVQGLTRYDDLVGRAIEAARCLKPRPTVFRRMRVPFEEAKHAWASFIIQHGGPKLIEHLLADPTCRRLRDVLKS